MKTIEHTDIIDLEDIRERLEHLESKLGDILNNGSVPDLEEFAGLADLSPEDLAQFTLEDYVSPMLGESEAEELYALREVVQDVGTCSGNALIADDHFVDFTREESFDIGDIDRESYLVELVDWKAAAEINSEDYNKIVIDSKDYWVRS